MAGEVVILRWAPVEGVSEAEALWRSVMRVLPFGISAALGCFLVERHPAQLCLALVTRHDRLLTESRTLPSPLFIIHDNHQGTHHQGTP